MTQNINPLDIDLSTVDTSRPLLQGPQYLDLKVEKAELVPGSKNPAARMLSLELSTTGPAPSVTGDTLGAGIRVFHRANIVPVGKLTFDQITKELGGIVQAAGLTGVKLGQIDQWYKQLEGRILRKCRVILEPEQTKDGKTYPPKNSVSVFGAK